MSLRFRKPNRLARRAAPSGLDAPPGGMMHSLRAYDAFRMLMIGTVASNSAFWMYQVAVGWLALQMTDSAFFVGMAGFAGGIPLLLVALPAGVVIDRSDRRTILLAAQVGVMLVAAIFALMVGKDILGRASMLVLVGLYGTIMSFVFPTRTAIVPSLVDRRDLANAIALNSATQNATRVIGPSFAGVMIGVLGIAETFAVAAGLQLFALLATVRLPSLSAAPSPGRASGWRGMTVGMRVVAERPFLVALIVLALAPTVLVMPYLNLMPVFARDELGLGSSGLGVLLASTGLGTVGGSLSVARRSSREMSSRAQVIAAVAFAMTVMAFALTPIAAIAAVLLFAAGWMSASFLAMNQTALQLNVEDEVRGRVLSIYLLTWGMLPIGQLLVGALAGVIGTPLAIVASSALALASIALIAWRFPALRSPEAMVEADDALVAPVSPRPAQSGAAN